MKMNKTINRSSWDATLNTCKTDKYNNAELTITLNLAFKQINPANGQAKGDYHDYGDPRRPKRKIDRWTKSAWQKWKFDFVNSAQKYWHGKFWLVNNFALYDYTDDNVKYIPNIWCKFDLVGKDASSGFKHHHLIEVVKLNKAEKWFGSHSNLYDSLDSQPVKKGTDSKGTAIIQRAHVHEVGHLLGLPHVDVGKPHCPTNSNTNLSPCYGVLDNDKYSVMGQGMQLREKHADPWREAIIAIAGKGNKLRMSDWQPKLKRHYPRTESEAKAKKFITVKPKR